MVDEQTKAMFALGLGITEPWYIKDIDVVRDGDTPNNLEFNILVDFKEGSRFTYLGESGELEHFDIVEKSWRGLNLFQYKCYITARLPRIKLSYGSIKEVDVPWRQKENIFSRF